MFLSFLRASNRSFSAAGIGLVLSFLLAGCGGGSGSSSPIANPTSQATPAPGQTPAPTATPEPTPTATPRPTPRAFPLRLACVGDSITFGIGVSDPSQDSYGAVLGRLLGTNYQLSRFGHSGATLLQAPDSSYRKQTAFQQALAFKPDIAVIALGTNDVGISFTPLVKRNFVADYRQLIGEFRTKANTAQFFLCIPPSIYPETDMRNIIISRDIAPLIRQVAREFGAPIVDLQRATSGHPEWFPDATHPNEAGARAIAGEIRRAVLANP